MCQHGIISSMHDVYIGIDQHLNLAREQLHYFCKIMKSEVIFLSSTSDLNFFRPLWFSKRLNSGEIMQCWEVSEASCILGFTLSPCPN